MLWCAMKMNIPAAKPYFPEEDIRTILEGVRGALESGQLTLGKWGKQLEAEFAAYTGTRYAIAVNSGTSALEIILRCLDIQGHSVIVPTNTFFATPASVIHAGGRVIFADMTEDLCLDPRSVAAGIRKDTRAVITVHIAGLVSPGLSELQDICRAHNLLLIEDAAHAHGSALYGKRAGSFGVANAFSFYPTKVMTSGEGGIITTDDEGLFRRAQTFRDQGKAGFLTNLHTELGYNWRMSEVHAVIGLAQFRRLGEFIQRRRHIAAIYDRGLAGMEGLQPLKVPAGSDTNYYKYVAFLLPGVDRAQLKREVKEKYGVGLSGEVYELPCHLQPVFEGLAPKGSLPVSEDLCQRMVCLPLYATMTDEEAAYVVDSLKAALG